MLIGVVKLTITNNRAAAQTAPGTASREWNTIMRGKPTPIVNTRVCEACGVVVRRQPTEVSSYFLARKACSQECRAVLTWRKRESQRREASVANTAPKVCAACGKPITRHSNESPGRFAGRKTCGYQCSGPKINRERQQRLYGDINQPRFCGACNAPMVRRDGESNAHYFARKTCNLACGGKFNGDLRRARRLASGAKRTPYTAAFTLALKTQIRERDGNRCRLCGSPPKRAALAVHHVNYSKDDCRPDNLIALCNSCHCRTNHNRDHWQALFRVMLGDGN